MFYVPLQDASSIYVVYDDSDVSTNDADIDDVDDDVDDDGDDGDEDDVNAWFITT